jgi:hypothetical protein
MIPSSDVKKTRNSRRGGPTIWDALPFWIASPLWRYIKFWLRDTMVEYGRAIVTQMYLFNQLGEDVLIT